MPQQTKGIDWVNIELVNDLSAPEPYLCRIHLDIELKTADVLTELENAYNSARAQKDPMLKEVKEVLKRELKRKARDNDGNKALVDALRLKP
jgi:hypothetical protein